MSLCGLFAVAASLYGRRAEAREQGGSCTPALLYPTDYPSAGNISPVLAIDFDGDGYLDLLEQFYVDDGRPLRPLKQQSRTSIP